MAAGAALSAPPEALRTGALALAAGAYWRASHGARTSLWALGYFRHQTAEVRRTLLSEACLRVADLREVAETGPPKIRDRAADALPKLLTRISAFVESRP